MLIFLMLIKSFLRNLKGFGVLGYVLKDVLSSFFVLIGSSLVIAFAGQKMSVTLFNMPISYWHHKTETGICQQLGTFRSQEGKLEN